MLLPTASSSFSSTTTTDPSSIETQRELFYRSATTNMRLSSPSFCCAFGGVAATTFGNAAPANNMIFAPHRSALPRPYLLASSAFVSPPRPAVPSRGYCAYYARFGRIATVWASPS
eukprot:CAMPEP_0197461250 /NCGR_PEP_ID=MMETSP1175-20131217/55989_1 /TAXON_ID=1003142 /ORGANISM="Triceratium dubium, Strain CCMP147" /LENGTH=115 /DNA_ID=CAMNT_0042996495 /DNA_START=217 /DNA_END=561 /DNA_ORIENTATION=-